MLFRDTNPIYEDSDHDKKPVTTTLCIRISAHELWCTQTFRPQHVL